MVKRKDDCKWCIDFTDLFYLLIFVGGLTLLVLTLMTETKTLEQVPFVILISSVIGQASMTCFGILRIMSRRID